MYIIYRRHTASAASTGSNEPLWRRYILLAGEREGGTNALIERSALDNVQKIVLAYIMHLKEIKVMQLC